jgi:ubiquinone/menaquinone biosynthesis C-methylase UbiE
MKRLYPIGEKGRERIAEKLSSGSVLDVACGTGTLLEMADQQELTCFGVDLARGMLAEAKKKVPNAGLVRASFYQIPYADGSFDFVVATNALSGVHIDAKNVLAEMIRVCKTGGWLYIAEWPKAEKETFMEQCVVWLASLNEDAPKDYKAIFKHLGYEPEVNVLDNRYHVFGIRK